MNQVYEFFRGLLDTDRWPPRWKCGYWSDFHGWLYIVSDLMIWLAYFLIPVIILRYFTNKKTSIRFQGVYLLFAAFILLCGTTHFLDAVMFWAPAYRLNALVRLTTAIVSLLTVYQLIKALPRMMKLPTNLELETEILRRKQVERKLEQANLQLSAFASMASHDLQEPLRKIRIYAEQLDLDQPNALKQVKNEPLEKIKQTSARMQSLIGSVLNLSTLPDSVAMSRLNVQAVVDQAVDQLEMAITEKQAEIIVGPLPDIMGQQEYVLQLLVNLIGNSLKFNERKPVIAVSGHQQNGQAILEIKDNGIGMRPQDLEKIFNPFERLHSRSRYAGSGIGLSICTRIMEVHKGSIRVESELGVGTIFILQFVSADANNTVSNELSIDLTGIANVQP